MLASTRLAKKLSANVTIKCSHLVSFDNGSSNFLSPFTSLVSFMLANAVPEVNHSEICSAVKIFSILQVFRLAFSAGSCPSHSNASLGNGARDTAGIRPTLPSSGYIKNRFCFLSVPKSFTQYQTLKIYKKSPGFISFLFLIQKYLSNGNRASSFKTVHATTCNYPKISFTFNILSLDH